VRIGVALGLVVALLGCAGWEPETRARERALEVLHCEEIELTRREESQWHATGCGREVEIACTTVALEPTCIQVRLAGTEEEHWSVPEEASDEFVTTSGDEAPPTDAELRAMAIADDEDVDPAADEGIAEDEGPPVASASTIEATIRRGLDARRADVLACTGRTASVVRVHYDLEGGLVITLAGDLEGSPEEGCVRAALSGVHVARGESGTVLHLLRGPD
jgi:hypothetical protein